MRPLSQWARRMRRLMGSSSRILYAQIMQGMGRKSLLAALSKSVSLLTPDQNTQLNVKLAQEQISPL